MLQMKNRGWVVTHNWWIGLDTVGKDIIERRSYRVRPNLNRKRRPCLFGWKTQDRIAYKQAGRVMRAWANDYR